MARGLMAAGCLAMLSLVACKDDGTVDGPDPITTGTITANDHDRSAVAETFKAFGFATAGTGVVYLAANPDATCDSVTEYLQQGGDYDPSSVLQAGHCSMVFRFNYDGDSGFDGIQHTDADLGTIFNVNCAMGDGTWDIVGEGLDRGYRFVGDEAAWWQGNAGTFTVTTSTGADDNTPDVTLDLGPDFGGQYIYEDTLVDPATGSVSGTVTVERCQSLTQTPPWN